ncbi:MAG: sensor histidine kinase [Micromonosporaceae bacterium]|nr:sensor histidine kinase [Micromonosporaceae bacterium]
MSASAEPDAPAHSVSAVRGVTVPARLRLAWLFAAIWLAYGYYTARAAWDSPTPQRYVALAALAAFVVTYLAAFAMLPHLVWRETRWARALGIGLTAVALGLSAVITALLGEQQLSVLVYATVIAAAVLPRRWSWAVVGAVFLGALLAGLFIPGWRIDLSVQLQILVAAVAMWGILQIIARNRQLAEAHQEIARLAAEEERLRLARDLHDILGHSLTVIAVKAELAGRVVRQHPDRAETEIADVERLARDALAEVRAAVAGYRGVTLATELANARTALAAAGIDAQLPTAIDDVPADRRELFGWVVREGVTNVLRHSGASRCEIWITPSTVSVRDDGSPSARERAGAVTIEGGHGLAGLRDRARAMGGTLHAGRSADGGFTLEVRL